MENGEPIPKFEVGRHLKEHKESNFDLWCKRMSKEEKGKSKSFEEENKEAGLQVIKAYLQTVSVGGSTEYFLRLVNFTHLIPGIIKLQKNNSRKTFLS